MIDLEIRGQKIIFHFSGAQFQRDLSIVKALDNRSYVSSRKYWTAPISLKNIALIRKNKNAYSNHQILDTIKEITEYKPPPTKSQEEIWEELKIWIAEKLPMLRKYQVTDVAVILTVTNVLNANEMGLGKTIESAAAIYLLRKYPKELKKLFNISIPANKILIICPSSLKRQWQRELKTHFDLDSIVVEGNPKKRAKAWSALNTFDKKFIIITNYENLRTDDFTRFKLDKIVFDMIIGDEITKCKNYKTANHKAFAALNSRKVMGLTGTPIENHLTDIFSIMRLINPNFFESFDVFRTKYLYTGGYMGALIAKPGAAEALALDLKNFWGFIRWNRKSVLKELPEVILKIYPIDLTPAEWKTYNRIDNGLERVKGHNGYVNLENPLTKMQVLLRYCSDTKIYKREQKESSKKKEFLRIIENIINGKKIVVFSSNKDVINNYTAALRKKKIGTIMITGDTKPELRDDIIQRFKNSEKTKVLMCTDALAYGANLQFCSTLINIDQHWNPAVLKQRIGRIQRIGQKAKTLLIVSFVCSGTVEEKVYNRIYSKEKIFDTVITANELLEECL